MKSRILLCLGLFFSMLLMACYADNATVSSGVSDPAKNILVEKNNPQFTITLASNRTTGYSWHLLSYDNQLITLVKHAYQAPQKALPGAGGQESWTFKVNETGFTAPQIGKIALLYAKSWNLKDNSRQVEFTVVTQ